MIRKGSVTYLTDKRPRAKAGRSVVALSAGWLAVIEEFEWYDG